MSETFPGGVVVNAEITPEFRQILSPVEIAFFA
jgi:hypothetical protein